MILVRRELLYRGAPSGAGGRKRGREGGGTVDTDKPHLHRLAFTRIRPTNGPTSGPEDRRRRTQLWTRFDFQQSVPFESEAIHGFLAPEQSLDEVLPWIWTEFNESGDANILGQCALPGRHAASLTHTVHGLLA